MKWIVISWLLSACYFVPYPYQTYPLFGLFLWLAMIPTWVEGSSCEQKCEPSHYWSEYREEIEDDDLYYDWDVRGPH